MSLSPRLIAIQGIGFTPIAMAVQGLIFEAVPQEAQPTPMRRPFVSGGGGGYISLSDYIKKYSNRKPLPIVDLMLQKQEQEKKRRTQRQRRQHRVAALASAALQNFE